MKYPEFVGGIKRIHRSSVKLILCEIFGYWCLCCLIPMSISELTIDHVIPRSKGGSSTIYNLQLLCNFCNQTKAEKFADYRLHKINIENFRSKIQNINDVKVKKYWKDIMYGELQ